MTKKSKILLISSVILLLVIGSLIVFGNSLKKEEITYSVKFNTNGGTAISSQVIKKGETASKPTDPIKEGYAFIEWKYNNKTFDFNTKINKDITLTAEWLKNQENTTKLIIKFETNGGTTIPNQVIEKNEKVIKPADPTKEGYVFKGWKLEETEYDFNLLVTKDITLIAVWEEVKPVVATTKYTVTFNSDGGSSVSKQSIAENGVVKKPTNPTKSGYDFKEWQLNGKAYNFSSKVTKSITLKAVWTAKEKVTVTFNSNGGSNVPSKTVYKGDALGTLPTNPTKSGYTFDGWYNGTTKYTTSSTINSSITLTAKWTNNDEIALSNAKNSISSSYNILTGGQKIKPTYSGCTITHTNASSIASITRGKTDTTVSLTFNVVCGSKTGTKTANGIIKASAYKYTAVANSNMQNYDLTITSGSTLNGTIYDMAGNYLSNVSNGKAVINNDDINGYPNYKLIIGTDNNTVYVISK